ncbi:hypothetical protein DK847_01010 [Aestuariivirga litoralis]|uniref:Lectin-like protein BA14k n=1 Tax=Aestuariivirga litoralis TaxID=2650924 RepID=A0A2W2B0K4_9HYPH|nr:BA14K family protein [Aestuariivirga litoralis]PZF78430.1 hypothetical protein DK847_01010 [Aestuariivirga litoralis]
MLKARLAIFAALAAGLLGLSAPDAGAGVLPILIQKPALLSGAPGAIVDVRYGGGGYRGGGHYNRPVYRHGYHPNYRPGYYKGYRGPRCRNWSNSCRFYYGGWYYNSPWWTVPVIGAGVVALTNGNGSGNRHKAWCEGRYKTYNPRTNTYVASGGKVKQCNSPYD